MNMLIADVDLATRSTRKVYIDESLLRAYFAGSGLAAYYLCAEEHAAEEPVFFIVGLLTGTAVPAACKMSVCAKSPLTGVWSESTVGGYFPQQLKTAGFDGLVLRGKSEEPVYIWLSAGEVEIRSAAHLWTKNTYETADILRGELGNRVQVGCIGPAGEHEVPMASIMFGGHDSRAAGRCGMGALLGSKKVKAIAARGEGRVQVASAERLAQSVKQNAKSIREYAIGLHDFGTAGGVEAVEANGDLPIKNWTLGSWEEGARKIGGRAQAEEILVGHYACWACPIRCGKDVQLRVGPHAGERSHGPEYETCAGFGPMVLNEDMHYLAAANDLCNRLGLDTISTSSVIAMAMELTEHGIEIPGQEGPQITWGDGPGILGTIRKIAYLEDEGECLAQGARRLGEMLGGVAPEFAVHTKGLEVAYHDPRAFTAMAVNYATANRGGCHLEALTYFVESGGVPAELVGVDAQISPHGTESKSLLAKQMQDLMNSMNALGLCKFLLRGRVSVDLMAEWTRYVTGWDIATEQIYAVGERLHTLKRMYNVRLGMSRKDDMLPPRLLCHDRRTGRAKGVLPHLGHMLAEYYDLRGWTSEGIPKSDTLAKLDLGWLRLQR